MSNTAVTGIRDISITKRAAKKQDSNISYFKKLKKSGSLVLIAAMFSIGAALALAGNIPVKNVMKNYSYDVLLILIKYRRRCITRRGFSSNCHNDERYYNIFKLSDPCFSFICINICNIDRCMGNACKA